MDVAREKATGMMVDAQDLLFLDVVDPSGYECFGCGAPVFPRAFRPDMRQRPHFATKKGADHIDGVCTLYGEVELESKRKVGASGTPRDGSPTSYPSRLVLDEKRRVVDPKMPDVIGLPRHQAGSVRTGATNSSLAHRGYPVLTIRSVCRFFVERSYERHRPLSVPGIAGTEYRSVFKKLKWDALARYTEPHLYYAAIRWTKQLPNDDYLEVPVDAGERDERGKLITGHRVRIEWRDWKERTREGVAYELDQARIDARKAHDQNPNTKTRAYLFFIGEQDQQDIALFRVRDFRLLCSIVDEIQYHRLSNAFKSHFRKRQARG